MPARSVVLERLSKWNGESHADVTPGEYTQLTGRAGRRGIDVEGHAVVLWQPGFDPRGVAGLASTRTYPLRSSFRPSYNMAVNLVAQVGRQPSRDILEQSFAQFQADRAVVGLTRQVKRNEEALAGYRESMTCHLGDFEEYAATATQALEALKIGDVIHVPAGRNAGLAVVLDPGLSGDADPRPTVLTAERQVRRLSVTDFPSPVEAVERMRIPKSFNPRSPQSRRDLAAALRTRVPDAPARNNRHRPGAGDDAEISRLRAAIRQHPCHGCDDRENHARWGERYHRLARETDQLRQRVESRTHTIAREFDRVCQVLDVLGYLDGDAVTPDGRRLSRIYSELDLLAAECLRQGLWEGLTPPELAACLSTLVYESRRADDETPPRLPNGRVREVLADMVREWGHLDALEKEHRLSFLREPDLGFAWAAWRWASGVRLDTVLTEVDLGAGDFVRWTRQLLDVLDQLTNASSGALRTSALAAADALRRGVVAYSSVG
jgi:ATP-dependent RNA helicase HelY